jgi:hypothetical protein
LFIKDSRTVQFDTAMTEPLPKRQRTDDKPAHALANFAREGYTSEEYYFHLEEMNHPYFDTLTIRGIHCGTGHALGITYTYPTDRERALALFVREVKNFVVDRFKPVRDARVRLRLLVLILVSRRFGLSHRLPPELWKFVHDEFII